MDQITIQAVSNGYIVFPSTLFGRQQGFFSTGSEIYVFNTTEELSKWLSDNFLPIEDRKPKEN